MSVNLKIVVSKSGDRSMTTEYSYTVQYNTKKVENRRGRVQDN